MRQVRIHSLRLRGQDDNRAEVTAALARLDESLGPDEGVLILRTLRVSGALPEIGHLVLGQARVQGNRAVNGWDEQADQAEAVRFASRADLLAALLRDLMGQRMRWFWRGWRELFALPPGTAIARLMSGEPLHWPVVLHNLARRDEAEALWRLLKPADARQLLMSLEQATGWPVCRPKPAHAEREAIRTSVFPSWLRAVAAGQANRSRSDTAVLDLAIVTWLWQSAPQTLSATDAGNRITRLAKTLLTPMPGRREEAGEEAGTNTTWIGFGKVPPANTAPALAESPKGREADVHAARPVQGSSTGIEPVADRADMEISAPSDNRVEQPSKTFESIVEAQSAETRFITRQGGWFLLLNALSLQVFQTRLETGETGLNLAVGWLWLYRLGRALGGTADPPLARFLAEAAGLSDVESLDAQPPLANEADLARLARARYGEAVCNAGLFPVPALVLATPSHLDVHYRMSDIRLDVRRLALDIDPGWLPWLGRVVRFNYGEVPELMGREAG